jgi:thiosulfate/3-mercaptopyruvate sulfurtransferase
MKPLSVFIIIIWGILLLYFPPGVLAQHPLRDYTNLHSAQEIKNLIESEKEILIIDNRPYAGYKQERIPGAKHFEFPDANISMDRWDNSVMGGKSKEDFIAFLGENRDRPLLFYCRDEGCNKSRNGASWALNLGYKRVYRIPGGLIFWKTAGYPVEK